MGLEEDTSGTRRRAGTREHSGSRWVWLWKGSNGQGEAEGEKLQETAHWARAAVGEGVGVSHQGKGGSPGPAPQSEELRHICSLRGHLISPMSLSFSAPNPGPRGQGQCGLVRKQPVGGH